MWFLKRLQLDFAQVDTLSNQLAAQAARDGYDFVVSIERGGLYPGGIVARRLSVPHLRVVARRDIDLRWLYGMTPRALRFIPALWQGLLFLTGSPVLSKRLQPQDEARLSGKRVLIVDDAVQSGKTLKIVSDYLHSLGAETATAVLSDTFGNKADYAAVRGIRYYPWSASSPEYRRFVDLSATNLM